MAELMDWHVVAGFFFLFALIGAIGFGAITAGGYGYVRPWVTVLTATLAVFCALTVPFLGGYIATGPCGFLGICSQEKP